MPAMPGIASDSGNGWDSVGRLLVTLIVTGCPAVATIVGLFTLVPPAEPTKLHTWAVAPPAEMSVVGTAVRVQVTGAPRSPVHPLPWAMAPCGVIGASAACTEAGAATRAAAGAAAARGARDTAAVIVAA